MKAKNKSHQTEFSLVDFGSRLLFVLSAFVIVCFFSVPMFTTANENLRYRGLLVAGIIGLVVAALLFLKHRPKSQSVEDA